MTTRRMSRDGRLQDDAARHREAERIAERIAAERIAERAAEGPRGPHTRADERRAAKFAEQRAAERPGDDAEPSMAAAEGRGRTTTVVQLGGVRRTRSRRGVGKTD